MKSWRMRRLGVAGYALAGLVAAVCAGVMAVGAFAASGFSVEIVSHTVLGAEASEFESNLAGCQDGTATVTQSTRTSSKMFLISGTKAFTCSGGESGFTLKFNTRGSAGSFVGTWVLADAWGDLAGSVSGSGSVLGIATSETSIDDIYTGTFRG